jgi:hypothetical protein
MRFLAIVSTLAAFCGSVLAAPAAQCVGEGYGTFYDDNACNKNPSVAFSMGNSGCIANQIGRNSIYIQGACVSGEGGPSLVWSPGTSCGCQNECKTVPKSNTNHCWNLNGNKAAKSFRFIEQGCGANNC